MIYDELKNNFFSTRNNYMGRTFFPVLLLLMLLLSSCAGVSPQQQCPDGTLNLPDCPPLNAVDDETINTLYEMRTWTPASESTIDPIKLGAEAKIPINNALTKIVGPSFDDALNSLAAKIWMIENAQHTVDASYYIFTPDLAGHSMLGAMCNAVKRGVDVRLMVDAVGSLTPGHPALRAMETCAEGAGFMKNAAGKITTKKARVQVVVFNALSNFEFNRRSHDKMLVVDGSFPDKAIVMTGGRNISLDYYGLEEDGSQDSTAFRDLEVLLKPGTNIANQQRTVGNITELYYTLLFLHEGNLRIWPYEADYDDFSGGKYDDGYNAKRRKSQERLSFLKSLPAIKTRMQNMQTFMTDGFYDSDVRLAHQLNNLTNERVTTEIAKNLEQNPNSIIYMLGKLIAKRKAQGVHSGTLRIVSPYLFSDTYKNEKGDVIYDESQRVLDWLSKNPNYRVEVITNSVMTGDNIMTQAIIDMEMAPGYLLTPILQEAWLDAFEEDGVIPDIVESDEWKHLINHPQVFIYQTGKLDSVLLGGDTDYGKLHAKFILGEDVCFIGTSNFDYRSNLYNSEMGFFIKSEELNHDLNEVFESLKMISYRWGTPKWLQMRKEIIESNSDKAGAAGDQRGIYKTIRALGLEYLM